MSSTITANGLTMNYRLDGSENAPVVMFSNSLMSDYRMWDDQVPALSGDYRILRYDTRGHGGSETPPGPYSIELLADDVVALLDALGIEKVHFVGLSMGGMIGQVLGARFADKLLSLVVADTTSRMPDPAVWDGRIATARAKGTEVLVEPTLERWFTAPFRETDGDTVNRIRTMVRATGVDGYVACAGAIRDMNLEPLLGSITVPTQVMVGADDPATPVEAARAIHEAVAGSRLVVIENAAHLPNIEQAETFNAALREFLGGR